VDAAVRELERELKVLGRAQAAPVESATTAKRKPAKQPVADEESVNWLRNAIAFLKPLAVSADELAAVERASTIAATVRIDEPSIEEVRGFLGNAFQRLRADLLIEAERLLAVSSLDPSGPSTMLCGIWSSARRSGVSCACGPTRGRRSSP